jgi:hypothetical protein
MLVLSEFPMGRSRRMFFRMGSCRTFYEGAVLQTDCPVLGTRWPSGHFNTSLDFVGIIGNDKCLQDFPNETCFFSHSFAKL